MTAGEAIGRMSNWARGTLHPFLSPTGEIDLQSDEAQEQLGLIKKYKRRRTISRGENFETETISEEIELYDAKDATDKMIQLYGRYKQMPGDAGGPKQRLVINLGDGVKLCLNG